MGNQSSSVPPGKLNAGLTEVRFEFRLKAAKEPKLYETYHGVFVNINYLLKCELKRSFLAKSIQKSQQFVIQYKVNVMARERHNIYDFTIDNSLAADPEMSNYRS